MIRLVSILAVIVLLSCQKKDSTPSPANSSTTGGTTTTAGGSTTTTGLSPSVGGDYCNLQASYNILNNNGVISKDSFVIASFYSAPVSSVVPTNMQAGNVKLNNLPLPLNGATTTYFVMNPSVAINTTLDWQVSGSGTVTAFTQSYTATYPIYTGGTLLPDTISKSSGTTLNINGVSNNQNSVTVYIRDVSATTPFKYILGSNGTVQFTASDLASFTPLQSVTISISLSNMYSATHGGIKRGFSNTISYNKICYLKP